MDISFQLEKYSNESIFIVLFSICILSLFMALISGLFGRDYDFIAFGLFGFIALLTGAGSMVLWNDYESGVIQQIYQAVAVDNKINVDKDSIEKGYRGNYKDFTFKDNEGTYYNATLGDNRTMNIREIGK